MLENESGPISESEVHEEYVDYKNMRPVDPHEQGRVIQEAINKGVIQKPVGWVAVQPEGSWEEVRHNLPA
ncbi:MAG: hypothetical protein ABIQ89_01725 [Candidatus Saccharimonadales bacterium]